MARAQANAGETLSGDEIEALVDAFLDETSKKKGHFSIATKLGATANGSRLLALDREGQAEAVARLPRRLIELDRRKDKMRALSGDDCYGLPDWNAVVQPRALAVMALRSLMRRKLPLGDEALRGLLDWVMIFEDWIAFSHPLAQIVGAVEHRAAEGPIGEDLARSIEAAIGRLRGCPQEPDARKAADRLARLIVSVPTARLDPGEAWSDAALAHLDAMEPERRRTWSELLASCQEAGGGKPTARWWNEVRPLLDAVGREDFKGRLVRWFSLVDRPRPKPPVHRPELADVNFIEPHHVDLLKGLAWCAGLEADRDQARALTTLALSAYRKVPGRGPRAATLGNAAVSALGMMPGMDALGQLALLNVKIKLIPARKEVEKALAAAAEREGLPLDEVDELAVPAYGMEEVGRRREVLGEYVAELVVDGADASLHWSKLDDGKPLKSVPAAAKKEHADEVKELQEAAKDVGKMLTAQRERIDGLFLARKPWPLDVWRTRYLDHPLVGTIARRLLWHFETGGVLADGAWLDGQIVGVDDRPLEGLGEGTTVALWHPIGRTVDSVMAWRDWLDRHRVRQPFKQAHREVYVLTDAERATRVYSNRFAAHVLRQHQYHALCAARGWRNQLRLMVDDSYPPTSKDLPAWGLRAEFWVEGIGDDYGRDVTESGTYLYLSTDQVRFHEHGAPQRMAHAGGGGYSRGANRPNAEPVPLESVPPLVFSEILRDVDLFVGVASVGNDPTWADSGDDGRDVDYWNRYSFGDLSANAQTRKTVLERLIPRLKIAPRCSFSDRFLVVRGDLRTYKIHLGSGNILMEPNDQYLCIVPKQGSSAMAGGGEVFLPFEGDGTLSIVLSKALLLADDAKIKDPTIVSQIRR